MTAPVLNKVGQGKREPENIMNSPVVMNPGQDSMAFVLPFHFRKLEEIPRPRDERIQLGHVPPRVVATKEFSGYYSDTKGKAQLKLLLENLVSDGVLRFSKDIDEIIACGSGSDPSCKWEVAQYHPPFTLPFFRRNEIWVELGQNFKG
jgi:hypothetical protein